MSKPSSRQQVRAARKLPGNAARYVALADALLREIADGRLKPRSRMPSEHELMSSYGLSRVTVRAALAILERDNLIVRQRGVGTFVAAPIVQHDLTQLESFYGQFVAQGFTPSTKLLEYRQVTFPASIQRLLGKPDGVLLRRLWSVDGMPFAVTKIHLHPDATRISHAHAEAYPAYAILEKFLGRKIARADVKLRAARPSREVAELLQLRKADPVLVLERVSYSVSNEALEHTECLMRSDSFEYGLTVRGSIALAAGFFSSTAAQKEGSSFLTRSRKPA
jgi:GntR family transcriptional regulator